MQWKQSMAKLKKQTGPELRWYQRDACKATWAWLRYNQGNPVIVLPTGAGKSIVIGELCRQIKAWKGRAIVLAHRKELLEQNAAKAELLIPGVNVGIYSAGLRKRDLNQDVVVAGIASVYDKACQFGSRQLVLIDEAHLVPNKEVGMYRQFLSDMQRFNQWCRVVGLTATPFRMQDGPICDGDIFTEICFQAPIRRLIDEGYLSRIITKPTTQISSSDVHIRGGEFIQKEAEGAFMRDDLVSLACWQTVELTADRKSVLVFTSGIAHAQAVVQALNAMGQQAELVVGDTPPLIRSALLNEFKAGRLKYLVNVDVLTTGFDAPNTDCVVVMRMTASAGLFAQMVGRGFRTADGKPDCLLLDFGGNLRRHGAIDSPGYGMIAKSFGRGDGAAEDKETKPPVTEKQCPECDQSNPIGNLWCFDCGYEFPAPEVEHEATPDSESAVLSSEVKCIELHELDTIGFYRHSGRDGKRDTFKVTYPTGLIWPPGVSEWICIEHDGWAREKAEEWWSQHCCVACPDTIDEALEIADMQGLRRPSKIYIEQEGKYWKVSSREFDTEIPDMDQWVIRSEEDAPF
jgi:DNA repair protein RadD